MTNSKGEALPKCILCETPLTQLGIYGLQSVVWYFRCEKEDCEMFMTDNNLLMPIKTLFHAASVGHINFRIINQSPEALVRAELVVDEAERIAWEIFKWGNKDYRGCAKEEVEKLRKLFYAAPHTDAAPLAVPKGWQLVPIVPTK